MHWVIHYPVDRTTIHVILLNRYLSRYSAFPSLNNLGQFLCQVQVLKLKPVLIKEEVKKETNDEKSFLVNGKSIVCISKPRRVLNIRL